MEPPSPIKRGKKANREKSDTPYTDMYVAALGMGFSQADLREMPFGRLAWFINSYNRLNAPPDEDGVRVATQADIDALAR